MLLNIADKLTMCYICCINSCYCWQKIMKITSILLIIAGIIVMIFCILHFKTVVNPVDSDAMTITPDGSKVSTWPIFIGIILTFVGITFYFVSQSKSNSDHSK